MKKVIIYVWVIVSLFACASSTPEAKQLNYAL